MTSAANPTPVLIDTDPGVDDAMAILMALASPELDVIGMTTVFGNSTTEVTTRNTLALLDAADRTDIPVAVGRSDPIASKYLGPVPQVHGVDGLGDGGVTPSVGQPDHGDAAEFLYQTVAARPGEVTILTLGPVTNLADAMTRFPDVVELVDRVVVMGGNALVPGNATPSAEANINNDPEAADLIFGAGWPITMVGLDVTQQTVMSGAAIDRISARPTPAGELLAVAIPLYRDFFEKTNGLDGIYLHDPSTVAYLLEPEAFSTEHRALRVETESFSRGKTWPNLGDTDEASPEAWRHRPLVQVCTSVDSARVAALVEERLSR